MADKITKQDSIIAKIKLSSYNTKNKKIKLTQAIIDKLTGNLSGRDTFKS
ncbi:hypothetical protein ThvES_00017620 [Thiovulum sp. ES]|nr:hypothetical protein ThvES_00017620 [Thiovulum sp. ES]